MGHNTRSALRGKRRYRRRLPAQWPRYALSGMLEGELGARSEHSPLRIRTSFGQRAGARNLYASKELRDIQNPSIIPGAILRAVPLSCCRIPRSGHCRNIPPCSQRWSLNRLQAPILLCVEQCESAAVLGDAIGSWSRYEFSGFASQGAAGVVDGASGALAGFEGTGASFFAKAAEVIATPWTLATASDFAFPKTTG